MEWVCCFFGLAWVAELVWVEEDVACWVRIADGNRKIVYFFGDEKLVELSVFVFWYSLCTS